MSSLAPVSMCVCISLRGSEDTVPERRLEGGAVGPHATALSKRAAPGRAALLRIAEPTTSNILHIKMCMCRSRVACAARSLGLRRAAGSPLFTVLHGPARTSELTWLRTPRFRTFRL